MHKTTLFLALPLAAVLFLAPVGAHALGISFGGRVTSAIPCLSTLGPSLHVTIFPAGRFPISYIWTSATITKLAGPPTRVGQSILGLADIPFSCFIPGFFFIPPTFFFGLRMQFVGTSAI